MLFYREIAAECVQFTTELLASNTLVATFFWLGVEERKSTFSSECCVTKDESSSAIDGSRS
jgi:hypothetical protein